MTADPNTPLHPMPPTSLGSTVSSAETPAAITSVAPPAAARPRYTGLDLWLHRVTVLMFVFVCASAGVLLIIVPWTSNWTDNHLLLRYPELRDLVASGFVRGLCSGLGVLDIWIGFWEAVHYREEKPK